MAVPARGSGPARNRIEDGPKARPAPKPKRAGAAPNSNGRPKPRPVGRAGDPARTTAVPVVEEEDDFSISAPGPHAPVGGGRSDDGDDADDFSVAATKPAEDPPAAEPGTGDIPARLGGYEVLEVLGKGGMGAVLLGRQISLNRKVAIKVMRPEIAQNPTFVARFTREAYAAAQLTHHNVVQIYDIGEDKGQHFFSMEFVHGRSLMDLLQEQGRLGPEAAVGYALQAARGLRQGHNQGMVHRDVKPANLLVNGEGIVKVADLGLVKLPSDGADGDADLSALAGGGADLTGAGMAVGTPAFMAPEQATGSAAVDARADVYSLGCTLYTLVTGRPPFAGASAPEVMSKHLTEPVVPPEAIVKRVPGALSAILMTMLAKDPDERYQSMDEVIAALEGFLGMPRSGTFDPSDHEAEQLERLTAEFQAQAGGGRKRVLAIGFLVACAGGIVAAAALGKPVAAVKALFLLGLAPVAYFVVHGLLTGGVVFARTRALAFGMRPFDWLMIVAGAGLLLGTLYLFGLHVVWVKLCLLSVLLAFYLWLLTDRVREEALREPLRNARLLCRLLRRHGLSEEQLREFVCKYGGPGWEPFFEALFGFEAKLAARALRAGAPPGRGSGTPSGASRSWRGPTPGWRPGGRPANSGTSRASK
ncbi:serine/threonine-protein kinase [Frigoriglobus tundricola]|uniref:serine/threonine-protein kinase n=1 Tax=Frigoriglobus tundricola TaxID=2774151 RepID=UPI00148EBFA3|nr:serine/threonine-protein kinase [Frigoriglobus tundricola]